MDLLMTLEDIARMWKCSVRHARDMIVTQPGFPLPAPGSSQRHRVWLTVEVLAFANRRPAQISQLASEPA